MAEPLPLTPPRFPARGPGHSGGPPGNLRFSGQEQDLQTLSADGESEAQRGLLTDPWPPRARARPQAGSRQTPERPCRLRGAGACGCLSYLNPGPP